MNDPIQTYSPFNSHGPLPGAMQLPANVAAANLRVANEAANFITVLVVGSAMPNLCKVRIPTSGVERYPILYGALIGESGDRKSALVEALGKPLYDFHAESQRQYKEKEALHPARHVVWMAKKQGLQAKLRAAVKNGLATNDIEDEIKSLTEPKLPRYPRRLINDISKRAFFEHFDGVGRCATLLTDEARDALSSSLLSDSGTVNSSWECKVPPLDRAHANFAPIRPHLAIILLVQSEVWKSYIEDAGSLARGSGLVARCLMLSPPSLKGFRFSNSTAPLDWSGLDAFHKRLWELLRDSASKEDDPEGECPVYEFDEVAKLEFLQMSNGVEAMQQPGGFLRDVSDVASKMMDNVARVAVIIHHFMDYRGSISVGTLRCAYHIVYLCICEAKRMLSTETAMNELDSDCQKLEDYMRRKWYSGWNQLPRRYINRNGPVRDKLRYGAAMYKLGQEGKVWISEGENKTQVVNLSSNYFNSLPPY